jgi:hypothetical protein
MRFNVRFTRGTLPGCGVHRTPTINHAVCLFIENKRYRAKPQTIGDVVNRNADSVYQTDQVLISSDRV